MKTRTRLTALLTSSLLSAAVLATATAARADDNDTLKWAEVVGILQAGNLVGSGTGQVTGGGQPWTTLDGKASVDLRDNRVKFEVRGLVLAGGNGIGTTGGINQVKGTLVCDTNGSAGGGNSKLVDTPLVDLDAQGNARFNDVVLIDPVCSIEADIAFLIRIGAGRWIANGAVLRR